MSRLNPKDRHAAILDAALRMSRLHGYTSITRADIATAAGCSEALVSSYMGTMIQVRRAVMRAAIKQKDLTVLAQGLTSNDVYARKAPDELIRAAVAKILVG